ncbi:MAG: ABC transporter substrate-binding protein [Chloroflexi bacterium]|nr:ABC transporter substrate-binding protein [Chloroflexota bacterium]
MFKLCWRPLIGIIVVSGLLLSCAPAAPAQQKTASPPTAAPAPPTTAPAAPPAPAATPKPAAEADPAGVARGGTFAQSLRDEPNTFDMHQGSITGFASVGSAYNGLLTWDHQDHNKMIGDLAKKWEVGPEAKSFTFYLEEGVKWHDGTPFTAEDVRYSLMRQKNPPKDIYVFNKSMFEPMQSVEVLDKYTVKVNMSRSAASFPMVVTLNGNAILPKHFLERKPDMKFDVMGTGPWKLKRYTSGMMTELVRNPEYFKKGLPYMDGYVTYIIKDAATRLAAFRVGRVLTEAADHEPPGIDQIEQTMTDVAVAYRIPGVPSQKVPFLNQTKLPFNDVRVRQAFSLALDRWEFEKGEGGFINVGGYMSQSGLWALPQNLLEAQPGYAKTGPAKDAEKEKARKLLADAGYPNGFDLEMEASGARSDHVNQGIWIIAQLAKVGIKATLKTVDNTTYYEHLQKQGFIVMSSGSSFDGDDPDLIFSVAFLKNGGKNYGKYYNPEFDKLFEEQATAVDVARRKEIVQKLQLILFETVPYPSLGWRTRTVGVWKKVKGYTPWTNGGRLNAMYRHEHTWLDPNLPPK